MSERRKEKLSELYKRAATSFLRDNIILENGIFSVTQVELADKLNRLTIYFSVWPDQKEGDVIKFLESLKKGLRKELGDVVKTRTVPEVKFILDDSEKKRLRIDELVKQGEK